MFRSKILPLLAIDVARIYETVWIVTAYLKVILYGKEQWFYHAEKNWATVSFSESWTLLLVKAFGRIGNLADKIFIRTIFRISYYSNVGKLCQTSFIFSTGQSWLCIVTNEPEIETSASLHVSLVFHVRFSLCRGLAGMTNYGYWRSNRVGIFCLNHVVISLNLPCLALRFIEISRGWISRWALHIRDI